jgi:pyruvate kinase
VNYDGLINDINVGDTVLVDNGVMHMKVLEKRDNKIRCEVLTPGLLGSRRHINLPGVKVNLPPLTAKDLADIEVGVQVGVDFFALSFCREPSDVVEFRRVLREQGADTPIIAKIEDQSAVREIDAIIEAADIIMIARGDLGIECPLEELPIIQRRIAKHCMALGRPVIVATHMLESMIENPVPTRAEITDIANAVFEQADAIMLSGETTVGKYPVECVRVFDRVARRIERSGGAGYATDAVIVDPRHKMVKSAVVLANSFEDSKLVIFTRRGIMANYTSHLRPDHSPIFAFSPDDVVVRRLSLNRATYAIKMPFDIRPEHTVADAEAILVKEGLAKSGDRLIVVSDIRAGDERFDSVHLREIP